MPLLYGQTPFRRLPDPVCEPDTKVFFLQESGESFLHFSDMMERLTVVHSNVWTCAVTKQDGLTLEEAFQSEKQAHKAFPDYGRRPILFIAQAYFQNASFTELVYGVYKIIRDRFFLDEWVRLHFGAKAIFARVIEVTHAPSDDETPNQSDYGIFPPQAYKYVVEYFDHVQGKNVTMCVEYTQLSRLPTYCSRNALHKYFSEIVEKDESSKITFKKDELERLDIDGMSWDQIFVQPEPCQGGMKRKGRPLTVTEEAPETPNDLPEKRPKLEVEPTPKVNEPSEWDKYRAVEKEVRIQREKLAEARLELWKSMEPSEDLDLPDLKMLPRFEQLNLSVDHHEFGDILNLYGFICAFNGFLEDWDPSFTLKDLVHAVYANEQHNQPLLKLMCCLVQTRNICIANEDYDEADIKNEREIPDEFKTELTGPFGDEIKSRNLLLERIRNCHGASLNNIQVDENSINQHIVYALHTAGFCPRLVAIEIRKENRGDICLAEDELFLFSLQNQALLDDLKEHTICELTPNQRLQLLLVFSKNLLTYGDFRREFQSGLVEMRKLTQRLLRLTYLEQQYSSDYADTLVLMDQTFPDFKLKRNGHSKKVDDTIDKFLNAPSVNVAIQLTQMKTRFDYIESKTKREELRKLQRNVIELRSRQIGQEMNDVYKRLGCVVLGEDRAFRQYIYLEELSLLFVEGPLNNQVLEEHCENTTEEEEKFTSCTSNSSCPIHSCHSDYQWFSLTNDETLNELIAGLDARGTRESKLLANLKVCVENVRRSLDSIPNPSQLIENLIEVAHKESESNQTSCRQAFWLSKLLGMEEKLSERSLLDPGFSSKRNEWRTALETNGDTRRLCQENGLIFDNADILIFDKDQLNELDSIQTLGVALFQVANALILECLKEPFADNHRGPLPIATTTFASWAQGVCNASSINELFFYLTSIQSVIKWSYKIPKNVSCTLCGARGTKSTMIKCSSCAHPFHKTCASTDSSSENFVCNSCEPPVIDQSSRRKKFKPGHYLKLSTVGNV